MFHSSTEKIYLNQEQHQYFDKNYMAYEEKLTICASTLLNSYSDPDNFHKTTLQKYGSRTLHLLRDSSLQPGWYYIAGSVY